MSAQLDWHVAVYASNEAERISESIRSIVQALAGQSFLVTVVVNGSRDASAQKAATLAQGGSPVEVYVIDHGDKANAINQFLHGLRRPARFVGQVDAYAVVGPQSFANMEAMFHRSTGALAATGVALSGRTMRAAAADMLATGGRLHGQFHAFRPDFLDRMGARGIRLPVGTYRGDGLLGSMAAHGLEPIEQPWRDDRIAAVAGATYTIPTLSLFRPKDVRRQYRREIRQARGELENAAIKQIIYRGGYEALPAYADEMIATLVKTGPIPPATGRTVYFRRMALKEVAAFRPPDPSSLLPRRLA